MSDVSQRIPGNPALEGIWHGSARGVAVVAPPHPMMGGHLSNPVVQALASGIVAAGHRALLFNFRGVGESAGDPSADPADADEDFRAALAAAYGVVYGATVRPGPNAEKEGSPLLAAGYSFGAAAAIRVACSDARVQGIVAVAPPAVLLRGVSAARLAGRLTIIGAEHDHFAPVEALSEFARSAPGVHLEIVSGADHFFGRGLGGVSEIARSVFDAVR